MPITYIHTRPQDNGGAVQIQKDKFAAKKTLDWSALAVTKKNEPIWDIAAGGITHPAKGLTVTIRSPGPGALGLSRQGGSTSDFQGDFSTGDVLLATQGSWLPIAFDFKPYVKAVALQIQPRTVPGDFFGWLTVYRDDGTDIWVEPETRFAGDMTQAGDGSALLLGAQSDKNNIFRISWRTTDSKINPCSCAINQLLIK